MADLVRGGRHGPGELFSCEFVESGPEALEARAQSVSFTADAHTEMLRHFEEVAGNHRGFVFFAQQFEKRVGITVNEARKDDGASRRAEAFEIIARIKERMEQSAIGGH